MWIRGTYPIDIQLILQVNSAFYGQFYSVGCHECNDKQMVLTETCTVSQEGHTHCRNTDNSDW